MAVIMANVTMVEDSLFKKKGISEKMKENSKRRGEGDVFFGNQEK